MNTPRDSDMDQDENNAAASFAHSLAVAPLDTANTIHNISVALGNGDALSSGAASNSSAAGVDVLMTDVTAAVQSNIAAMEQQSQLQPAESRMAVAELLVSLGQHTQNAVDYVGSVKKAYENNPKVYTEFLTALEQYHGTSLQIDQLVRTVMGLFQDQPDLLLGFKEFLPEAQGLMNQLVPPMMYSDYKGNAAKSPVAAQQISPVAGTPQGTQQEGNINSILNNGHAAADFLSLIKEKSQQEPDMYQHLITLLRKFQKEHSYANLYFYVSIILRYHPHLLQRFHKFLPSVTSDTEVKEPRFISKAPPEELVVSPDFIEAKDFVQTVKYAAKNDMSMYDRFIFALEKYQRNGWTIDQVYSEVSLIFWNHPDALAGFKLFISSVPPPSQP
ncbi:Paired amphipathic helix protein Sin3b [Mortierella alpina]|uniref:Paired amphipathic helix protein Sin3b n=1 Tax=Mortierella alpina TaxID=64518 RepID=A0A9P6IWL3_MORAP|nr:Paired amphipathic helix protein Sin3b [Mortierella alpina]